MAVATAETAVTEETDIILPVVELAAVAVATAAMAVTEVLEIRFAAVAVAVATAAMAVTEEITLAAAEADSFAMEPPLTPAAEAVFSPMEVAPKAEMEAS